MKRTLSLLLSVFMILSLLIFNVHAEDVFAVTPTESDYAISNSMITGLKTEYIDGLDENQKQNIQLVIPDSINGINVVGISNKAFSQYYVKNCYFKMLDLSQMTHLKKIGDYAFYTNNLMKGNVVLPDTIEEIGTHAFDGCSSLTGSLILPNSLKTIGTYAFSYCVAMKGELTLSNQLKVISNYAFQNAGFTGNLSIPLGVEKICESAFRQTNAYDGFSGQLIIPNSVTTVEKVAFSNQNKITSVEFSKNMTTIPESMFRYCKGLTGVLEIPNYIQSIGMNAFSETNLKTIYLPEMIDQTSKTFIIDSPFYNCTNLIAIVCKEKDYKILYPMLSKYSSVQKKLTYETKIELQDKNNNVYNPLIKLYNYSYQYVKQDDKSWKLDTSFRLPSIVEDHLQQMKWSTIKDSQVPIYETSIVGLEKVLYVIEALVNPVITYSEDIDKVYDGKAATLSVNATHPKYVDINNAKDGDIVFYYTWKWSTIGSNPTIQSGFDLNTLNLTDVYNPTYEINCIVTVQACYIENNKAKVFYTTSHNYGVFIQQEESIVHPKYKETIEYKDGLPNIQLSDGDTNGTISWDANQVLKEGIHTYQWTFIPENNQVGSCNYTIKKGTAQINALNPKIFQVQVTDNGYGHISPNSSFEMTQGENVSITITPDNQYTISSFKVNGKECLSQLTNHVYHIKNIQSDYMIEVKFEKINIDNIEHIIDDLPKINDNQTPTQQQVIDILEAKLTYENLGSLKDDVSKEVKKEFNKLLMKLPQIEVDTQSQLVDDSMLLDNMTIEDIEMLLNDPQATLSIHCDMIPVSHDLVKDEINGLADDINISQCLDIELTKVLSSQGQNQTTTLSQLKSSIQLILDIPKDKPLLNDHYYRKYYIIRIHDDNGNKEVTILENESLDPLKLVISSDKFSLYAIAYKDIEKSTEPTLPSLPDSPIIITPTLPNEKEEIVMKPIAGNAQNVITSDNHNMTRWLILGLICIGVGKKLLYCKRKR